MIGKLEGPLDLAADEKVIFAGDCTSWEGTIDGEDVKIENSYQTPGEVDEKRTKSNDMLLKTAKNLWSCFRNRKSRYIRARGCPLSVAEHVNYISAIAKIRNVNFDPRLIVAINMAYWQMRTKRFLNRFVL
ncbi:hypothetical protein ACFL0M_10740 [Thermodesulfobacteriota bacterium]